MLAGEFMVWWAALCQKVQGHFLAPVRPLLLSVILQKSSNIYNNFFILFLKIKL